MPLANLLTPTQKKTIRAIIRISQEIWCLPYAGFTFYMWEVTHDTWHMTHDTWHMTCDTWQVGGGATFLKMSAPLLLRFGREGVLKIWRKRLTKESHHWNKISSCSEKFKWPWPPFPVFLESFDELFLNPFFDKLKLLKMFWFWSSFHIFLENVQTKGTKVPRKFWFRHDTTPLWTSKQKEIFYVDGFPYLINELMTDATLGRSCWYQTLH